MSSGSASVASETVPQKIYKFKTSDQRGTFKKKTRNILWAETYQSLYEIFSPKLLCWMLSALLVNPRDSRQEERDVSHLLPRHLCDRISNASPSYEANGIMGSQLHPGKQRVIVFEGCPFQGLWWLGQKQASIGLSVKGQEPHAA